MKRPSVDAPGVDAMMVSVRARVSEAMSRRTAVSDIFAMVWCAWIERVIDRVAIRRARLVVDVKSIDSH